MTHDFRKLLQPYGNPITGDRKQGIIWNPDLQFSLSLGDTFTQYVIITSVKLTTSIENRADDYKTFLYYKLMSLYIYIARTWYFIQKLD